MHVKWTAILLILIIALTGCSKEKDYYGGVTKDKIFDLNDPKLDYMHEFKGHRDNWGAVLFFYKYKETERVTTRTYLIYNGKDLPPTGDMKVLYQADEVIGESSVHYSTPPEEGIYLFLGPVITSNSPTPNSKVKIVVQTNDKSETIDLSMDD